MAREESIENEPGEISYFQQYFTECMRDYSAFPEFTFTCLTSDFIYFFLTVVVRKFIYIYLKNFIWPELPSQGIYKYKVTGQYRLQHQLQCLSENISPKSR